MRVVEWLKPDRSAAWTVVLSAALLLAWGTMAQTPAHADDVTLMSISVSGSGVSCSADVCTVELGSTFTATVAVDDAPDGGYILVQSFIDYGTSLTYNRTEDRTDELLWPDVASEQVFVRGEVAAGLVNHGGLTGLIPPLPASEYVGPVFEIALTCTDDVSSTNLQLLPAGDPIGLTNGAMFTDVDAVQVTPKVNSITINCGQEEAPDGDGDGDGDGEGDGDGDLPGPGGLPPTGNGGSDGGSMSITIWLAIAALAVAAAAGLGTFGWRTAHARQQK